MKRVTMLILSLLLICGSLVMSSSFTDSSPPGIEINIVNQESTQLNIVALEVQEFNGLLYRGDITIGNSNLTNWPSTILRQESSYYIIEQLLIPNQLMTNQFYLPINKKGIIERDTRHLTVNKEVLTIYSNKHLFYVV